ncbi:MAG: tetratricopeptide repeat protein [Phycisphaerae bacterium]|nr:tetratricopeptide repeat protein [Phycisphaerae bacterium]
MDRFSQLEFGDTRPAGPSAQGEAVRDAAHFHKEAVRYWLSGDHELALRNYCRVLEQNNTVFEGWTGQVLMLIELGEYKEADLWADKALELFPDHPELLALKAIACVRDARVQKAIGYSDQAIAKDRPTARAWLARAEVFLDRNDAVVDGCLAKALATAGQDSALVRLEVARLLRRRRSYPAAIGHLQEVVKVLPKAALAWYELGCCQQALGLAQARASLEQALRMHPHWAPARQALRRCRRGFWSRLLGRS